MLRICIIATILFVTTAANAQMGIPNVDPRHPPSPGQVIKQVAPNIAPAPPAGLPPPAQVAPGLAPDKVLSGTEKAVEHGAKEGEKLLNQGIETGEQIVQGATSIVSGAGGPVNCPLDKLIEAAHSLEGVAKSHADEIKKFNDQMAATAKNVGDAQLSIIKKTVEEAGNFLLNPFKPLIDIVNNYKKYYDDLIEAVKTLAWKFVLVIGVVLGFMIGLPFWILIRAITPRWKHA
jgi:hypothetical protein